MRGHTAKSAGCPRFQPAKGANALWQPKGHPTTNPCQVSVRILCRYCGRLNWANAAETKGPFRYPQVGDSRPVPIAEKDPLPLLRTAQLGKRRPDEKGLSVPPGRRLAGCANSRKGSSDVIGTAPNASASRGASRSRSAFVLVDASPFPDNAAAACSRNAPHP